jgi:hypothetical protein
MPPRDAPPPAPAAVRPRTFDCDHNPMLSRPDDLVRVLEAV